MNNTLLLKKNSHLLAFLLVLLLGHGALAQSLCTPTSSYRSASIPMGTESIDFDNGSMSYSSTGNYANAYFDNYGTLQACVEPGNTYSMELKVKGSYDQAICIWVDWNNDNVFDNDIANGEKIDSALYVYAGATQSFSIPIPSGVSAGKYRMRVLADYYSDYYNGYKTFDPCTGVYGDFVDLQLTVVHTANADIAVQQIIQPSAVLLSSGNNAIKVAIKNYSTVTIDSVRLSYQFSNGSITTELVSGMNLQTCGKYEYTFQNPLNISAAVTGNLKVWVKYPNGLSSDADATNDTAKAFLSTPLKGSYTIDSSKAGARNNFKSFADFVTIINEVGVDGAVTIKVNKMTYYENVTFGKISGISDANLLTIDGSGGELISGENFTLKFDNASFIKVKNLTVINSNNSNSKAVYITNSSSNIILDSLTIIADTNTNYNSYAIAIMGDNSNALGNLNDSITVMNSFLRSYYTALSLYGDYATYSKANSIKNNVMVSSLLGVDLRYADSNLIMNNKITSPYNYLLYSNSLTVKNNEVLAGYAYGWYITDNKDLNLINNSIQGSSNYYGIYLYNSDNVNLFHNSIFSSSSNNIGLLLGNCTNVQVANNIISCTGAYARAIDCSNASSLKMCEYNNFYCPNSSVPAYVGKSYNSINALQGANGLNKILYNKLPDFNNTSNSPYDLHLKSKNIPLLGDNSLKISTDIDGDARCEIAPSIGSDESKYIYSKAVSSFTLPDSVYRSTPFNIQNNAGANLGQVYSWGADKTYNLSNSTNFKYLFSTTGTHSIQLVTANCKNTDTATKNIVVITPSKTPVVNFIANKSIIDQSDSVYFYNTSTGGDTAWDWTVTQGTKGTDYDFLNSTPNSNEVSIQFYTPGLYEICLQGFNAMGSSKICKSAYIEVVPVVNMCQNSKSVLPKASFYDDGGVNGTHGYYGYCSMLIDPCAGILNMEFTKFDVANYYSFLRIWDGVDSKTGTPLHSGNGWTGTYSPGKIIAKSGRFYIEWSFFNPSGNAGWEANWWPTAQKYSKPVAAFTAIPSTAFVGVNVNSQVLNYKPGAIYNWLLDNNLVNTGSTYSNSFSSPGSYQVCLAVSDCGGADTFCSTITIVKPTSAPVVDFILDYIGDSENCYVTSKSNYFTHGDTILLKDISGQGPTSWQWSSNSSHVIFISGKTAGEALIITDSVGTYDITLVATNSVGSATVTKSLFITIVPSSCVPTVQYIQSDIGINEIQLHHKRFASKSGISSYSDYSNTSTFCVSPGGKYPFVVSRNTAQNSVNQIVWIDINHDGTFDNSEIINQITSNSSSVWSDSVVVPLNIAYGETLIRFATNFGKSVAKPCGPELFAEFEDFGLFVIPDAEAPVITIIGANPDVVGRGKVYNDSGAIAWDAVDGYFPANATGLFYNNVNVDSFYIYYNATDLNGNIADTVKRLVYVAADNQAPIITLNGDSLIYVDINSNFSDPGVSAFDSIYGAINASNINVVGSVNIKKFGTYKLNYTACDPKNNCASISRTVIVGDTTRPIIYLSGANPLYLEVGDTFVDPGVQSIFDNYSKNLSYTTISNVNNLMLGSYKVLYQSEDSFKNRGTESRVVIVRDTKAPQINLAGGDTIVIEATRNAGFKDPGYAASDNYFTALNWTIVDSVKIDKMYVGQYQYIYYDVADQSGNKSSKVRTILLQKTSKPWLILKGNSLEKFMKRDTAVAYNEPGVDKFDAFYDDADLSVSITGSVDLAKAGIYELRYQITDPVGNKAVNTITRVIDVISNTGILAVSKSDLELYPNPASDFINIKVDGAKKFTGYKIYNQFGQLVKSSSENIIAGYYTIQLGELSQGLYFIVFNHELSPEIQKIQIVK